MPVFVRTGEGDFHQDLKVHFGDIIPKATGDDVLCNHSLVCRDNNDLNSRSCRRPTL